MKKLMLSGVLALCAAASFAQNTVTVTQSGTANSADAQQTGTTLMATISQVGAVSTPVNNNTANTLQTGTGHTATINQNDGSTFNRAFATQSNATGTTGANSATLSQSNGSGGTVARGGDKVINTVDNAGNFSGSFQLGSGNKAAVMQDDAGTQGNLGEISQRGTTNTATTTQSKGAKNNLAETFQGYNQLDVTGNNATINQDISTGNLANVKQLSNTNTAKVDQSGVNGSSNKAYINQGDGTNPEGQANNLAEISQPGGSGGISSGNSATVTQTSNGSQAFISQSNISTDNIALITQVTGSGSVSRIRQLYTSSDNKATITEYGFYNGAIIEQQHTSSLNEATIKQETAGASGATGHEVAVIIQSINAKSNMATIEQNQTTLGQYNKAVINQTASTSNVAMITQENSYNTAGLVQTGVGSNTATFSQSGNNNIITGPATANASDYGSLSAALQDGFKNSMIVKQTSPDGANTTTFNKATLNQTGDMNTLSVTQTLDGAATMGNMATVSQNGNMNVSTVSQSNGTTN